MPNSDGRSDFLRVIYLCLHCLQMLNAVFECWMQTPLLETRTSSLTNTAGCSKHETGRYKFHLDTEFLHHGAFKLHLHSHFFKVPLLSPDRSLPGRTTLLWRKKTTLNTLSRPAVTWHQVSTSIRTTSSCYLQGPIIRHFSFHRDPIHMSPLQTQRSFKTSFSPPKSIAGHLTALLAHRCQ